VILVFLEPRHTFSHLLFVQVDVQVNYAHKRRRSFYHYTMDKNNEDKSSTTPDGDTCPPVTPTDGARAYFGYAGNPFNPPSPQLPPWWLYSNNTPPFLVSTAPVPETVIEGNKKKNSMDTNGPLKGQHYTLKEMTVLVDQVHKIGCVHDARNHLLYTCGRMEIASNAVFLRLYHYDGGIWLLRDSKVD
jgi:hypothetical protein